MVPRGQAHWGEACRGESALQWASGGRALFRQPLGSQCGGSPGEWQRETVRQEGPLGVLDASGVGFSFRISTGVRNEKALCSPQGKTPARRAVRSHALRLAGPPSGPGREAGGCRAELRFPGWASSAAGPFTGDLSQDRSPASHPWKPGVMGSPTSQVIPSQTAATRTCVGTGSSPRGSSG